MEIEDQECKFPLDQLPELIIDKIAWYLSNRDLAACCAVSRGVREAFDIECVWRPRYDADRAEYLLKTPCKVHPIFESPENTNNDFSPISQSRLAFMAENHLWNNWRQGKFLKEDLNTFFVKPLGHGFRTPKFNIFITDDYLASIFLDSIEISDVRYSPASRAFDPISIPMYSSVKVANDKILVLYKSSVQVFHLDDSTNQWVLKHSFFIEETEVLHNDGRLKADISIYENRPDCRFTVLDHFIVGVVFDDCTMHIWNYETGVKLKKELCPVENAKVYQIVLTTTTNDLVLCLEQHKNSILVHILVYSLPQLKFLAFRKIVLEIFFDAKIDLNFCLMVSNFISVSNGTTLNIYDYQNCKVKLEDHPIDSGVVLLGNNVVFLKGNHLKLFNPCTSKMKSLGDEIKDFTVLCNRFVIIERCSEETTFELIEFDDNCGNISKKITSLYDLICDEYFSVSGLCIKVNKHSARAITRKFLWNFW